MGAILGGPSAARALAGASVLAASLALAGTAGAAPISADPSLFRGPLVVPFEEDINDPYFKVGASTYSGVGGVIVNTRTLDQTGFVGLCTGTFVNPRVVVTAAHCYAGGDVSGIRFRTGDGLLGEFEQYQATHFWVHPNYNPDVFFEGYDIAAFVLDRPAANGEEIYDYYDESGERGEIATKVGFGTTGSGETGTDDTFTDYAKRVGFNTYELFGDELFSDILNSVLLYDFDNGNPANDAMGALVDLFGYPAFIDGTPLEQTGIYANRATGELSRGIPEGADPADYRLVEVASSPGDSGGATFIDGRLAGVTSFGVTAAILDGGCGPGFIDVIADEDGFCTNSSFGEFAGDTRVSSFAEELEVLATFRGIRDARLRGIGFTQIPEPGMLPLFGLGAVALVAARRSRR